MPVRAYLSSTPDERAIPDPGGRLARYVSPLHPPVSLRRTEIGGVPCFVERFPGSTVLNPAAVAHAEAWLLPAERRAAC